MTNTDSSDRKSENYTSFNSAQQMHSCIPVSSKLNKNSKRRVISADLKPQSDTKGQHVHMNTPYYCLLRRKKAHKKFKPCIFLINFLAGVKAKHIKKNVSGTPLSFSLLISISISNKFILIILPTSILLWYPYIALYYISTMKITLMKTKISKTLFWRFLEAVY